MKLNDRNLDKKNFKGQSIFQPDQKQNKLRNQRKNLCTDWTGRAASIISNISSKALMAPFETKFDDLTESSIKKGVIVRNKSASVLGAPIKVLPYNSRTHQSVNCEKSIKRGSGQI